MLRVSVAFAIAVFGVARQAHAFCEPGEVRACFVNGVEGTQTCGDDARFGPCIVPTEPPPSGTVLPKYMILTVIYAPPGRNGGGSGSSVNYQSGSSLGSTVSSSAGFTQAYSISASASIGTKLFSGEAGMSWAASRNTVDTTAEDFKKTSTWSITEPGPALDGIDHDHDEIWLWLGPTVDVSFPSASAIEWSLNNGPIMSIQFAYVGQLKNPATMPQGLRDQFNAYGLTTDDFAQILTADPFAYGAAAIDSNRYAPLNMTFPYMPPLSPGDRPTTTNFTASMSTTNTVSRTASHQYSQSVSASGSVNFLSVFHASLKASDTWTWTHSNSHSTSTATTESASVTIGGPAYGYAGPTNIAVYFDAIYKTFMFAPFVPPPHSSKFEGAIVSDSGASVLGKEVTVTADGVTYRTLTDDAGTFRVYLPRPAAVQLRVGKTALSVAASAGPLMIPVP